MNITVLLVLGAGVLLVLAIIFVREREHKKRIEDLKGISNSLGFIFTSKVSSGFLGKISGFYVCNRPGSDPEAANLMTGQRQGLQISVFDFHYTIGDNKVSTRYDQTILLVESPKLSLPAFILRPESVFDKIGSLFGGQDIDFDSNPDFSNNYLLRGNDENRIRETFSSPVISYFETHRGVYTEGNKDKLLFFLEMGKDLISPEKITQLVESGIEACQVFLAKDGKAVNSG